MILRLNSRITRQEPELWLTGSSSVVTWLDGLVVAITQILLQLCLQLTVKKKFKRESVAVSACSFLKPHLFSKFH